MNLSPEQKKAVSTWIKDGASISDVQKRLREEFQLSLTYIDTRFLIDDLGLELKRAPAKPAAPPTIPAPAKAAGPGPSGEAADVELVDDGDAYDAGVDEFAGAPPPPAAGAAAPAADDPAAAGGPVAVEIDRVTRPGTVVSGSVKFSDGNSGKWALDQYGRLIFEGANKGYRPSPADLQAFQRELSTQLQRHGY